MTGFNSKREAAADKLQEPEREALKLAKDVLLRLVHLTNHDDEIYQVVDKCEAALAQPAQESYDQTALELCNVCGWKTLIPDDGCLNCERAPPQREWVGLTDEDIADCMEMSIQKTCRAVEAKLKERNS